MIDTAVAKLVRYAEDKGLIASEDHVWAVNTLLEALHLDSYTEPVLDDAPIDLSAVLDELMDDAHARGVLENDSIVYRDLFDTALMGRLTPPPREVIAKFRALYAEDPVKATDWYYRFSQDTNYIRRDRIAKDVQWKAPTEYGELDITINLSKPEKIPRPLPRRVICRLRHTRNASFVPQTRATPGASTTPPARTTASFPLRLTDNRGFCSIRRTFTIMSTASA